MTIINKQNQKKIILKIFSITALIVIPVLYVIRGLDLTDTGFVLTNQRLFFSHPEHISYWFHLYVTNFIGAIINQFFGQFGIISMKLASVIIFWLSSFFILKIYKGIISESIILFILAVSSFFWFANKINIIHYNNLSALFIIIICYFLYKGFTENRLFSFFFAGFFIAISFFTRLPNIMSFFLFFAILLYFRIFKKTTSIINFQKTIVFFLGIIIATGIIITLMCVLGHETIYYNSIKSLFATSTHSNSQYGIFHILKRSIRITFFACLYSGVLIVAVGIMSYLAGLITNQVFKIIAIIIIAVLTIFLFTKLGITPIIAGLSYFISIFCFFLHNESRNTRLTIISLLSSCSIFFLCIGSDTGLDVSTYMYPFFLPLLFVILTDLQSNLHTNYTQVPKIALTITILTFIFLSITSFHLIYRDSLKLDSMTKTKQLGYVFTNHSRAQVLDSTINELRRRYASGSELFIWDSAPLIYYATNTLPWLDNPWPVLYVSDTGDDFLLQKLLEKKASSKDFAPILLAKKNPRSGGWPVLAGEIKYADQIQIFIETNSYSKVWENDGFVLYEK